MTLIDEYLTSQLFQGEDVKLEVPYTNLGQVMEEEYKSGSWRHNKKYQIYAVRYKVVYEKGTVRAQRCKRCGQHRRYFRVAVEDRRETGKASAT